MSEKQAVIIIKGEQIIDGESDVTEIDVTGTLSAKDDGWLIEFTEYISESETVHTEVFAKSGYASMTKQGSVATEMIFEKGVRHNGEYSTPFGDLTVGVYTERVYVDLCDDYGTVELEYNLDFNTGFISENKLEITVNPNRT